MKKIFIILHTILLCLTSTIGWSSDLIKGFAAAQKGDFATAVREWKPFAEEVELK